MRYTFTVGVGEDRDGNTITDVEIKVRCVIRELSKKFGGATTIHGTGGWINENKLITEPCVVFIVEGEAGDIGNEQINNVAIFLRDLFRQTCVVVSIQLSTVRFV